MKTVASSSLSTEVSPEKLAEENARLHAQLQRMKRELDWFKKQVFGPRSEKQVFEVPDQNRLFEPDEPAPASPPAEEKRAVNAYQRGTGKKKRDEDCLNDTGLRFGPEVPVEVIEHLPPELTGPQADQFEIVDTRITWRLGQRPSSYVVLRHERPVIRRKGNGKLITPPAPPNVLEKSLADVSLLAGLLTDKFQFHLPLYRQHQRMRQAGITVSRATLTQLVKRTIELLRPIVDAQTDNVLRSRVLAMDETPIKAGHQRRAGRARGRMKAGWFWPLYGDADEVVFTYSSSRGRRHIEQLLNGVFRGTLLSDGYAAYARYARDQADVVHAQCWVHGRRYFIDAQGEHPEAAGEALRWIAALYRIEERIRALELRDEHKHQYRLEHSKPIVEAFFAWCREQLEQPGLLPSDALHAALGYMLNREESLKVFLEDPAVALDTNHLESALRPIPMGRKNWLFCWTELGAEHVGIIQSLICTCKLHGINPYTYLVDVLQRVEQHPAREVANLTPRRWKVRYADDPLRSALNRNDRNNRQACDAY